MFVDFKLSTWERVIVPDALKDDVVAFIKKNPHATPDDLVTEYGLENCKFCGIDNSFDEYLTPETNSGQSTIEVIEEDYDDPFKWGDNV